MRVYRIIPDIIIHSRGNFVKNDNLVVIEMKKSDSPESEKVDDKERLKLMTRKSYNGIWTYDGKTHPEHVCGYILGIYMELNIHELNCSYEFFRNGRRSKIESSRF